MIELARLVPLSSEKEFLNSLKPAKERRVLAEKRCGWFFTETIQAQYEVFEIPRLSSPDFYR